MTQRNYIDIGGTFPMEDGQRHPFGPHGLWFYPNGQFGEPNHNKYERPYGYSPFFVFGTHATIKGAECCYSDRYPLWDADKMDDALAEASIKSLGCPRPDLVPGIARFIKAYHGTEYKLVGVVEWCNVGNGFPCWSFHFKKVPADG